MSVSDHWQHGWNGRRLYWDQTTGRPDQSVAKTPGQSCVLIAVYIRSKLCINNCIHVYQSAAWLSVWSVVQMICIWSSWCHCYPIISCFSKLQNGLPFWCRLTQVILEKRLLNVCMYVCMYQSEATTQPRACFASHSIVRSITVHTGGSQCMDKVISGICDSLYVCVCLRSERKMA